MGTEYKLIIEGVVVASGRVEDVEPSELIKGDNWIVALRDLGDQANVAILHENGMYHPRTDIYDYAHQQQSKAVVLYGALNVWNHSEDVAIIRL
ncbi:hypothetical protein K5Q02_11365 [Pseudomonas sp. MM211]|uniref:hypothetical protein n=1 Tax=Pseudomonas sp. MM211 TaxID=2866808 RepID=UPI001CECA8CA|nr:hypothetical protein [Pseudomonas sp. MM211]UCJ18915.1 hypothetical protein K5Q02_11365 [Pseudomonas sp. MM211]